jgi:uncharacterized membrane protein
MPTTVETRCQLCGVTRNGSPLTPAALVRPALAALIKQRFPAWSPQGFICAEHLNDFRAQYVRSILEAERGELSGLESEVIESLRKHETLASHVDAEFEQSRTLGERLADRIATFGGSWKFITVFGAIVLGWIALNALYLVSKPFDPYPFILLNLVLSCLAAIQAPVIMMSQNRQEARDRLRAANDYQVNLKAELEIRQLHQKVDHLLSHQWQRLVEIQEVQLEIMRELQRRSPSAGEDESGGAARR